MAFGLNIPVIPISSMAALAQSAHTKLGWGSMLVAIDARMEEVYWGHYRAENGLVRLLGQEQLTTPEQVTIRSREPFYGLGNAWHIYSSRLIAQPIETHNDWVADAAGVLLMAKEKWRLGQTVDASNARPSYLRDKVAQKVHR